MSEQKAIQIAVDHLRKGELVALPTETVYGLAANIDKPKAIEKIFLLKERPFFDPLIVHISKFRQIKELVSEWPAPIDFLTRHFWPGPLTVVVPKSEKVSAMITSGLETVALRMPRHPMTLAVLDELGIPVAAPSANKFGRTSPTKPSHVAGEFKKEAPYILDGGECDLGLESTVIQQTGLREISILRPGGVTLEELCEALENFEPKMTVTAKTSHVSPGHLEHHYMPEAPLLFFDQKPKWNDTEVSSFLNLHRLRSENSIELKLHDNPAIAARLLYDELRKLSENKPDFIWVLRKSSQVGGLWSAIWDRLERASRIKFLHTLKES